MSTPALELKDLRKSFGKTEIIRGCSLAVNAGERVAVMQAGRVAQVGPPRELLAQPASDFVRNFLDASPV